MDKPKGAAPSGWYFAPEDEGLYQYWNGKYWTAHQVEIQDSTLADLKPPTQLSFLDSVRYSFSKTFNIKGRASRAEYWKFQAFFYGAIFLLAIVLNSSGADFLTGIALWAMIPTQISIFIRRCHDSNKRGWWYFIPFGNFIVTLINSDRNANRFGKLEY
jgi:uncharacterized membrane protein YhaH (DUF805 family)